MLKSTSRRSIPFAVPFLALGLLTAGPHETRADFNNFQILWSQSFEQTGADTVIALDANFLASASLGPIGDYTSATLTPPGASTPLNMGLLNLPGATQAMYTQYFATPSEMEAAFPRGVYTFAA